MHNVTKALSKGQTYINYKSQAVLAWSQNRSASSNWWWCIHSATDASLQGHTFIQDRTIPKYLTMKMQALYTIFVEICIKNSLPIISFFFTLNKNIFENNFLISLLTVYKFHIKKHWYDNFTYYTLILLIDV